MQHMYAIVKVDDSGGGCEEAGYKGSETQK